MDVDNSGLINYYELLERVQKTSETGDMTKKFLMTVAWSAGDATKGGTTNVATSAEMVRDLSSWRLDAPDAAGLVAQLRKSIKSSGFGVLEFLEIFNFPDKAGAKYDADSIDITHKEFVRAMRERLGYTGPMNVLREAFNVLSQGDDRVDVDEFFEFITGRKNAMKLNRKSNLVEMVNGMRMVDEEELEAAVATAQLDPAEGLPEQAAE